MKVHRDDVVEQLHELGRHEDADRALEELPEKFRLRDYEGKLRSYGLHPDTWNVFTTEETIERTKSTFGESQGP